VLADGRTLVVAETLASRLTSFHVEDDGTLSGRSVWAQLAPPPPLDDLRACLRNLVVAPDGIAVDDDDHMWVADAAGGGCLLVARGGEVLRRVDPPPGHRVFACSLGGERRATLLLCCAPDAIESRRTSERAGILASVELKPAAAGPESS